MSVGLALARALAYAAWTAACMPIQAVLLLVGAKAKFVFPQFYHRIVLKIVGIRLDVRGRLVKQRPTLVVANHTSYLDIEILGALVRGSFVARADMADWPLFGSLAKLQRTVFVDRRPSQADTHRHAIAKRLERRERLILFPEGTTGDGNRVLPFKRALFAVAQARIEGEPVTVQPVSIAYARFSNLPMGRELRATYAWYGDMELMPHAWRMLGAGVATVVVQFHAPLTIDDCEGDRRMLAERCERIVADGVADALAGHLPVRARRRLLRLRKDRAAKAARDAGKAA